MGVKPVVAKESDKRRQERRLAEGVLINVTLTPFETDQEIWGVVVDYSAIGFQITVPQYIAADTMVRVTITRRTTGDEWEIEHLVGRVVWCAPDAVLEETYNLGIEVLNPRLIR